ARMLEYSPYGFGKSGYRLARGIAGKAFTAEQQRQFAQTFGRASVGSGLLALGAKLYLSGQATGLSDDDPSRRARDLAAGRIPGAILVDGSWRQVTGFSPLGNLIAIGATLAREATQERTDESQTPGKLLEVATQSVGQQPL